MSKFSKTLLIPLLFCLHGYCLAQASDVYYMRADYDEPWCCGWAPYENSNPLNLTEVFGVGGWNMQFYEYADAASIFNANTCYVFMEGGESHTDMMEWFFSCNQTLIEQWVYEGGSLFINAAPNVGDGLSFGFGDIWLWYPYAWPTDVSQDPAGASHMIWSGPYTPTATNMFGPAYAHAYVSGTGITPIITETYNPDQWVLAEKSWGLGHVFFGGMTTACWHWPATECVNIRQNMHSYMYVVCGLLLSAYQLTFTAQAEGSMAKLCWNVDQETEAGYYAISRAKNGTDWEELTKVDENASANYTLYDQHPLEGKSYYRVRHYNAGGIVLQEKIASVTLSTPFDVYPNPAKNTVIVSGHSAEQANYTLWNTTGDDLPLLVQKGTDEVLIYVNGLAKGTYTLMITSNGSRSFKSLIII